ncbi:MAG: hypothetical protein LBJ88_04140 [Campylobacteraceae bacterium]|jgi:hypothetical protein|nr:hypothetical protein [Campylobacteraceae bacterium]
MNFPLIALGALGLFGLYKGMKAKDPSIQISTCFFDRLAVPIYNLLRAYYSNSGLMVDIVKEESIICNTPYPELFGITLEGNDNTLNYLDDTTVSTLFRDFKKQDDAYFFYVVLKQGLHQKQYIFSHNKTFLKTIASYFNLQLMKGEEITNALLNLYLQNSFYIENKAMKQRISVNFANDSSEPSYMAFKKLARQSVYNELKDVDLFQSYKVLEGVQASDIQSLFKSNFDGVLWIYMDLSQKRVENYISKLITISKWTGTKKYFTDLKQVYSTGEEDLLLVNSVAMFKKYDEEIVSSIGNYTKAAFIQKELFRRKTIQKTPLKYRDTEFDYMVSKNYLKNFITTVHKKNAKNPDVYGLDKNKAFVNYSFSEENDNPHSVIIAKSGSGKSFSKQKIMAQMIDLDFVTAEARNLGNHGVKIRSYDIGFSDEIFVNFIKTNVKNKIAHIASTFGSFSYNIININMNAGIDEIKADLQFATDLMSVILESQNSKPLNISESALFRESVEKIYSNQSFQKYRVRHIEETHTSIAEELLSLGYEKNTFLSDIKEEKFYFLKTPLLGDITKYARIQSSNQQLKEDERHTYASLAQKCSDIEKLEIFSRFDNVDVADADFLSMDLNNFKESSLFTPIFLSIFQKTYLRDREYALHCKRMQKKAPKLYYPIEESKNFFRIPYFEIMLEKLALEARKYNVHLCFIAQNAEHIPEGILKNIDTRIFLLRPDKKVEVVGEVEKYLHPPKKVIEALNNTEKYELCIWYSSGVFNLKFVIEQEEFEVFNTNPNVVKEDKSEQKAE